MPFTDKDKYIVGKSPIHTQIVLTTMDGSKLYIPVKSFSWTKDTELVDNLHSGSPLPSDLVDGHHKYTFSFETGTWFTEEVNKENARYWEYLAYTHLVRPSDAGRPQVFNVQHRQASYTDDEGNEVGSQAIMEFTGCKISKMGFSQGENGINKRTYEGMATRMTYGTNMKETN